MENITTTDKNVWVEFFTASKLPIRNNLNFETIEEWQNEYRKTKEAFDKKEDIVKQLVKENVYTLILTDDNFEHYLEIIKSLNVNVDDWLKDSDDVNEEFLNDFKTNKVKTNDIYMTKPYTNKRGWFLEFDNYINDNHISTFFIVSFKQLNEFVFIICYANLINLTTNEI